jgi:transcription elongation factor
VVGNYELHDLVQLEYVHHYDFSFGYADHKSSMQTVGVIFKTERDSFRVLDQNGQVRLVQPHQIAMRRSSERAIATDSEGYELRINDNMKEIEGEVSLSPVCCTRIQWLLFITGSERSCPSHPPILLCFPSQSRYR